MDEPPAAADANVRAPCYQVARTLRACWHCGGATPVVGIALPPTHETLIADGEDDEDDEDHDGDDGDDAGGAVAPADVWRPAGARAWIFYVQFLCADAELRLRGIAPLYRYAYSRTIDGRYWINHCAHCGAAQGDHYLHCEPDVAFMPTTPAAARRIVLFAVREPFAARACGHALDPPFLDALSATPRPPPWPSISST
ncbi:MAG TPA: hypothetical protein VMV25_09375 [Steroidobacteraceae bacterium]|nr:hypothetical protein [Steroidobacteraceae bacterium]